MKYLLIAACCFFSSAYSDYIPPQRQPDSSFFEEIQKKSDLNSETFSSIASFLLQQRGAYHQFSFRYPIGTKKQAEDFIKVMQIKAQEAHRFVPVIADSQFIEPRHLGFSRRIVIVDGRTIQEHVLVDSNSPLLSFSSKKILAPLRPLIRL